MERIRLNEEFRLTLIDEINLVRQFPENYANKIRKYSSYFKGKIFKLPEITPILTNEGPDAFEEAALYLDNLAPTSPMKYHAGLVQAANDALSDIQLLENADNLSQMNVDEYLNKYGTIAGPFALSIDLGSTLAELVVINLLVDDGDVSRCNRTNMLNSKFRFIGVSFGMHPVYHNCTVVMYARHYYDRIDGELSDENYEDQPCEKVNNDFELPEGCLKVERREKIVSENEVKTKIVKIVKHKEDGTIETEIFKEKL